MQKNSSLMLYIDYCWLSINMNTMLQDRVGHLKCACVFNWCLVCIVILEASCMHTWRLESMLDYTREMELITFWTFHLYLKTNWRCNRRGLIITEQIPFVLSPYRKEHTYFFFLVCVIYILNLVESGLFSRWPAVCFQITVVRRLRQC